MMHWRARRLIFSLPDGTLSARLEAEVRDHVGGCRRCQHRLADIERAEELLQRMPLSVAPLDLQPASHGRLVRLALWSDEPAPPSPERWRAPALGVAGLVAAVALALTVGTWSPVMEESPPLTLAMMPPESIALPVGYRPGP